MNTKETLEYDPIFEEFKLSFPVPKGVKIMSNEPYVKELYNLYMGEENDIKIPIVGETISGTIIQKTKDYASVDIGGKEYGYIDLDHEDKEYLDYLVKGEAMKFIVKSINPEGSDRHKFGTVLSFTDFINQNKFMEIYNSIDDKTSAFLATIEELIDDAGYWITIDGIKAFLPGSLASMNKISDYSSLIGKEIYVMPITYSRDKGYLVVSHKKYLETAILPNAISELKEKLYQSEDLIECEGRVTGTSSFGIFVEWNECLTGLIYKTDMDKDTYKLYIEKKLKAGTSILFKVKDILNNKKIILTQKNEYDPWLKVEDNYTPGKTYSAEIVRVKPYGIFVELEKNLVGLLPDKSGTDKYKKGETVKVKLISIERESRKLFLAKPRIYKKGNAPKFKKK